MMVSFGLTTITPSDDSPEFFEEVVLQPEMAKIEHKTAKRFEYEGVMLYYLIFYTINRPRINPQDNTVNMGFNQYLLNIF